MKVVIANEGKIYLGIWALCFLSPFLSYALTFSNLTMEDGLVSNDVYTMLQDKRGYLWIGTKEGLQRFDGTQFSNYRHNRFDSTSIPANWIVSLAEDRAGNIWMGTWEGVGCMNPYTGKVKRFQYQKNHAKGLTINHNNKVFCDKNGKIWVINPHGLFLYHANTSDFECKLDLLKEKEYGVDISQDSCGDFWVSTLSGFYWVDGVTYSCRKFVPFSHPPDNAIGRVFKDSKGAVWVPAWGGGLCVYAPDMQTLQIFTLPSSFGKDAGKGFIATDVCEQIITPRHRIIWVAKFGELMRLDIYDDIYPQNLSQAIFYKFDSQNPYTYIGDITHHFHTDRQGTLRIGTNRGISQIIAENQRFELINPKLSEGLTQIFYDTTSSSTPYWLMSWYGHTTYRMDTNFHITRRWQAFPPKKNLDAGNVSEIISPQKGEYWMATFDGLLQYNAIRETYHWIQADKNKTHALHSNRVVGVFMDKKQQFWITLYRQGLQRYHPQTGQWKHFTAKEEVADSLPSNLITGIFEDNKGLLWILTNKGICRYNPEKEAFEQFSQPELKYSMTDIIEYAPQQFWLGTEKGVVFWDTHTQQIQLFASEEGLDNDKVIALEKDKQGNIWILTENKLNLFNSQTRTFTHFGRENGFYGQSEGSTMIQTPRGEILIGDNLGRIYRLQPQAFSTKSPPIFTYIESLLVNGQIHDATSIAQNQTIVLSYTQNQLQFQFAGIDLIHKGQLRYACRLLGNHQEWQQLGNKQQANFINVPPGEYQFQVKTQDLYGKWYDAVSIPIIIKPPFWQTYPFLIAAAIGVFFIFGSIVRYVYTRKLQEQILILEREQAVEKERNRISRDMHDDMGSTLSKIAIMSEVVLQSAPKEGIVRNSLVQISHSSRELLENMQHIIWLLSSSNDTLDSFAAYLREYTSKLMENTTVTPHFDFSPDLPAFKMDSFFRREVFLILKEALNNSLKYANATDLTLSLHFTAPSLLNISVTDNGKGFDKENTRLFGNGIKNMQMRVHQLKGHFQLQSKPQNGTKIFIEIRLT